MLVSHGEVSERDERKVVRELSTQYRVLSPENWRRSPEFGYWVLGTGSLPLITLHFPLCHDDRSTRARIMPITPAAMTAAAPTPSRIQSRRARPKRAPAEGAASG